MSASTRLRPRVDRPRRHDERGSVSAFVVVITATLVLCAGLVFDGGRLVAARIEAGDHAENAARAGAQMTVDLRSGRGRLDADAAKRAASAYLARHGIAGSVVVGDTRVVVTVTTTTSMTLLAVVGVPPRQITVARSATAVTAVTG